MTCEIFFLKYTKKCVRDASPRPLYKNSKLSIYLDQQSKMLQSVFILCPSQGLPKYIEIKVLTTHFILYMLFLEKTRGLDLELVSTSFSVWFLKINISHAIFYWLTKFHCFTAFTSWDIGYVCWNYFLSSLWSNKFWN